MAAEWKTKLAEWSPAIKAAMAAKGPNAAAIAKLLAQATALSKPGGDMAQAIAALTKCNALATTGAVPEEPDAEVKKATTALDADKASFKARVAEAKKQLDPIKAADPAGAKPLAGLLMQAISLGQTNAYADATLRLDEFDKQLAAWKAERAEKESEEAEGEDDAKADPEDQAETAQPTEDEVAPEADPKSPTIRWEAAREKALARLEDVLKIVIATKHPDASKAELELKVAPCGS